MEEENKRPKNKGKGLIITLVIAIIIILGLVMYILYDKGIILNSSKSDETSVSENNSKNEDSNEDTEVDVDINDDIIQNLYSMFRVDVFEIGVDNLNNDNLTKLLLAYENIPEQNLTLIQCSSLDNKDKYKPNSQVALFCGDSLGDEQESYTTYLNANLLEAKFHMLFGSDYKVIHESFNVDCSHTMVYDKNQNIYALYNSNTGCASVHEPQELLAASKKGDELYMKTALKDLNNGNIVSKINYTFKKDSKNGNYVFVKAVEEKS